MTNRRGKRQSISDVDEVSQGEPVDPEKFLEHWLPTYAPGCSVVENARTMAKALWGHAFADWTWCLAQEVAARFPEAIEHDQGPGWVAGVLWAAAVEVGMHRTDELWSHILDDITQMTGVNRPAAEQRWELLKEVGLDRPARPPTFWDPET